MTADTQDYISYLLRLWRVRDNGECWRAALERVEDGQRRGFEDLEALFAYLRQTCASDQVSLIDRNEE